MTYLDGNGDLKLRVDEAHCVACGACVTACAQGARFFRDDTDRFFMDLARGRAVSVVIAPSFAAGFPEWRRVIAWLRSLGVSHVFDGALGADICVWGHLRLLRQHAGRKIIAQPCPPVVSYIETRLPQLVARLSPIHSPMACTAIYMRKYLGIRGDIAGLSPCAAKGTELKATAAMEYNVTFDRLAEHLGDHRVALPREESGFDHLPACFGASFPIPGGFRECLEFFLGDAVHVEQAAGPVVFERLDAYARAAEESLPDVFDALSCAGGCAIGAAQAPGVDPFRAAKHMRKARSAARAATKASGAAATAAPTAAQGAKAAGKRAAAWAEAAKQANARLAMYDDTLDMRDFTRRYQAAPRAEWKVTDADIERAFEALGKRDTKSKSVNCGACGSRGCAEQALKMALGRSVPQACLRRQQAMQNPPPAPVSPAQVSPVRRDG